MPPWKPETGAGEFVGVRRLSDTQIATIQKWVDQGTPEGDAASLPPAPQFNSDWRLGPPDLVLTMDRPYTLRAGGDDMYRHFVIPITIPSTRYIKAWEFRPRNPRVVHHATMQIDRTGASRQLDAQDPEPGESVGSYERCHFRIPRGTSSAAGMAFRPTRTRHTPCKRRSFTAQAVIFSAA